MPPPSHGPLSRPPWTRTCVSPPGTSPARDKVGPSVGSVSGGSVGVDVDAREVVVDVAVQVASEQPPTTYHRPVAAQIGVSELEVTIAPLLHDLYPAEHTDVRAGIVRLAEDYRERLHARVVPPRTQATTYLITYGDAIRRAGQNPLHTLGEVLREQVGEAISDVHLLPMFPRGHRMTGSPSSTTAR